MRIQKIISWTLLLGIIISGVFQLSSSTTNAQQANQQPIVVCAPNKKQILRNEKVTFTAAVRNAGTGFTYGWKGTNIKTVNSNKVTVSYGTIGTKKATVTVLTTSGVRVQGQCSVDVKANIQLKAGQNQQGQQQNDIQQQLQQQLQQMLGGQGQGGQNPLGQTLGGNNPTGNTTSGSQTPLRNTTTGGTTPNRTTNAGQTGPNSNQLGENDPYYQNQEEYENGTGSELDADEKKCEENTKQAEDVQSMVKEQTETALSGEQQQMVPVNPVPVVEPTLNVQENIKLLTAKEIGTNDSSSTVALDKKAACKVDVMLKKALEKATNFIYKGDNDDGKEEPMWVGNFVQEIGEQSNNSKSFFITELQNNPNSCNIEEDKKIARALLLSNQSIFIKNEGESCPIQKEDPYDLTKIENFMAQAGPSGVTFKLILATEQMNRTRGAQIAGLAYELDVNEGFKSKIDKDKMIVANPKVYLPQTLQYMLAAINRYTNLDEIGEGEEKDLQKLLEKVIQTPSESGPGGLEMLT